MDKTYFFFDHELTRDETFKHRYVYSSPNPKWEISLHYGYDPTGASEDKIWMAELAHSRKFFYSQDPDDGQHALNELRSQLESAWNFMTENGF